MKFIKFPTLLLCAAALSACTTNESVPEVNTDSPPATDTQVASTAETTGAGRQKMICKKITPTGSRLGKRVCGTQEQWDAASKASEEALRAITHKSAMGNPDGR